MSTAPVRRRVVDFRPVPSPVEVAAPPPAPDLVTQIRTITERERVLLLELDSVRRQLATIREAVGAYTAPASTRAFVARHGSQTARMDAWIAERAAPFRARDLRDGTGIATGNVDTRLRQLRVKGTIKRIEVGLYQRVAPSGAAS